MDTTNKNKQHHSAKISIYNYTNYRDWLRDFFEQEKIRFKGFSLRKFANNAGFGSSGYMRMVMDGDRNISPKSISAISRALKLTSNETAYFENLVLYNQAKTEADRDKYLARLTSLQPKLNLTELDQEKYNFFTKRYYVIIREMVALPDFKENPVWIATRIHPPIKPKEAEHAINVLLSLGLLARNNEGKLVQSTSTITTPTDIPPLMLQAVQYHCQMLSLARDAIFRVPQNQRDINAVTVPVCAKALPHIKNILSEAREKIVAHLSNFTGEYEEVYQLNVQLFPVTQRRKSKTTTTKHENN